MPDYQIAQWTVNVLAKHDAKKPFFMGCAIQGCERLLGQAPNFIKNFTRERNYPAHAAVKLDWDFSLCC